MLKQSLSNMSVIKKSNSSPIQTLLSVLEFHQIKANAFVDYTTGREFHPALKTLFYIFNCLHHKYNILLLICQDLFKKLFINYEQDLRLF